MLHGLPSEAWEHDRVLSTAFSESVGARVPSLPVLTRDDTLVFLADLIRGGTLLAGAIIVGLCVRHMFTQKNHPDRMGFLWRLFTIVVGSAYVGIGQYERIERPVTVQFLVSLVFIIGAWMSVHVVASKPPEPPTNEGFLRNLGRD